MSSNHIDTQPNTINIHPNTINTQPNTINIIDTENDAIQSNNNSDNELCIICYDNLEQPGKLSHTIPECGHSFHQNCINAWFRQGNQKCPLCNDLGAVTNVRRRSYYSLNDYRYSALKRISKKKNAPKRLVNEISKITKKENTLRDLKKEINQWRNTEVILNGETCKLNDIIKKDKTNKEMTRRREWNLRKMKRVVCDKLNMAPIILVEKKVIK